VLNRANGNRGEQLRQMMHQGPIADSTAADEDFAQPMANEPSITFHDAVGGEVGDRRKDVTRGAFDRGAEDVLQQCLVEEFASGRFGWWEAKIWMSPQPIYCAMVNTTTQGEMSVGIKPLSVVCDLLSDEIDQTVSRPRIKRDRRETAANDADIRDAAKVLERANLAATEEHLIEVWHKRCTFTAGGEIARAEVRDDGQSSSFRDDRWLAELERGRDAIVRAMVHRMAVGTDDLNPTCGHVGGVQNRKGCPSELFSQRHIQGRELGHAEG